MNSDFDFKVLLQISDPELQKAKKKTFPHLLVHLGVQQGPGGLVSRGSPLIETKKGVNNPPGSDMKQTCNARTLLSHPSQLVGICVQEPWYIGLVRPQWKLTFFYASSHLLSVMCEAVNKSGRTDWCHSPLFLELQGGQINPGVREGPEKYPHDFNQSCFIQPHNNHCSVICIVK